MCKLARRYKTAPAIYQLSRQLIKHLPPKNHLAEAETLYEFVQQKVRYVRDIHQVETIQTPIQTLKIGQGDCDDKSTLLAALYLSVGYPVKFVVVGRTKQFYHVFVAVNVNGHWIDADACEMLPLGQLKMQLPLRGEMLV